MADSLELRGKPKSVRRFNRRALIGLAIAEDRGQPRSRPSKPSLQMRLEPQSYSLSHIKIAGQINPVFRLRRVTRGRLPIWLRF